MTGSQHKIGPQHLERRAIVYLRQSTPRQVRENFRSTELQYGLADEAVKLGWQAEQILTVDGDLGISSTRNSEARDSYKELVGRVCLGEVGAIFGLEVSRLARSNAETQRLLEYCGLTDTLVIDGDGIYDLRDVNDQIVLGVKGQLAQMELHVMSSRLHGAKPHAAERGELHFPLPVGLVYDDEGNTLIDPDQEVQAAIADLFKAFLQTGSAYGVVGVFRNRRFPRRAYGGAWAGELRWGRLTHARVLGVLSNPSYASAYVYGRYRSRRVVRPDGAILTRTVELPRSEWAVVIQDHHEGYISWEQFLANEQRLAANTNRQGQRPPREGGALCHGILRCGACGGSMTTLHRRQGSYYEYGHSRANHVNTPGCRSVKASVVDELIARGLLDALAPEEMALALAAADEHADRRARSDRVYQLRVERARYEAIRAERASTPASRTIASSPAASKTAGSRSGANSKTPRPNWPSTSCRAQSPRVSRSRRSPETSSIRQRMSCLRSRSVVVGADHPRPRSAVDNATTDLAQGASSCARPTGCLFSRGRDPVRLPGSQLGDVNGQNIRAMDFRSTSA
jgi:DNA invertase Pin-like site-specific DNA recombinase